MATQAGHAALEDPRPLLEEGADRAAILAEIARVANASPLLTLSRVAPHGWPMTACMHFSINMEHEQPRIYMFTAEGTRKVFGVAANPRVALSIFTHDQAGNERLALSMRGLCHEVVSPSEHALAIGEHSRRPGYEFTRFLTMQYQAALRVDVERATLFNSSRRMNFEFSA